MSIARSQLIGKKVYNPDGSFVGDVVDIGLAIGESQISLIVATAAGTTVDIPWSNVSAAKDIILLKEAVEVPKPTAPPGPPVTTPFSQPTPSKAGLKLPFIKREKEQVICPTCGQPATWIPQYQRWYCYNCQKYL